MTEAELQQLCTKWQKLLRLQDWDVGVKLVRARDMGEGNLGEVKTNSEHKRAEISLLNPIDHDPVRQIPYDMEQTLIHELLHLHFDPFLVKDGTPEATATAQEQAINATASALVNLARQIAKKDAFTASLSAPTGA